LQRFEDAWRRGERPVIQDYLAAIAQDRRVLLIELVHEELEHRLKVGEPVRVESYLEEYVELRADPNVAAGLIAAEYFLRQRVEEKPGLAEYLARFPEYAEALRDKLAGSPAGNGAAAEARTLPPAGLVAEAATLRPVIAADAPSGMAAPATHPAPEEPLPTMESVAVTGYEVLGLLGRGGMGVVYKARQVGLDRLVALKMILYGQHATPEDLERFHTEAQAVARLQHLHIVQVHEVGEYQGLPYFSMEFCPGGSLADQLDGTPWEARRAAALVEALARAVNAAHQARVIHRDLKPANVLLAADGTPKVTDFGLAKRLDVEARLTQSGAIVGTPSYMAPEQAGGKATQIGPATDVYALGAILYELLTGRPPFKAATAMDTVLQLLSEEPVPVRRLQPQVPRDLETICHHCLEKDPAKRYASAQTLAEDLRRFQAGEPIAARPAGQLERAAKWVRRRPTAAALVGLTVLMLAGVVAGVLTFAWQAEQGRRKDKEVVEKTEQYLDGLLDVSERDLQAGRFDAAIAGLTTVEALRPGDARAGPLLLRARAAQLLATARANDSPDDAAVALQALGKLLDLDPEHAEARALQRKITGYEYLLDSTGPTGFSAGQTRRLQEVWARRLGRAVEETVEIAGGVKMTFVLVPPGKFLMGSPLDEEERRGDERLHEVTLTEPFYLGKTEVTQAQYEALTGKNPSYYKGADRPVEQVDWEEAQAYAERLTKARNDKHLCRLPTEAEWEYSCRGGRSSAKPFGIGDGRALSSREANFHGNFPYGGAEKGPSLLSTCPVGSYPANALGLFDMHGNVCEWCADWFALYPAGAVTNPTGPKESSGRVFRGGCWSGRAGECRAADHRGIAPSLRSVIVGFRLARSVPSSNK
jgi:formylglycine-generating enzyme required for sulfatase activity